jgi:hypothetical protein
MRQELQSHAGYFGVFTRDHADEAIPNGASVMKSRSEPHDATPTGTLGTVMGSIDAFKIDRFLAQKYGARFFYFVEWADKPRLVVGVMDNKIARAS